MVLEYNGNFGPERSLAIARDTDMSRAVKGFHGASLMALTKLAAAKGYKLLACDESGTNAFFVSERSRPWHRGGRARDGLQADAGQRRSVARELAGAKGPRGHRQRAWLALVEI